jgi:hypothetical protein
MEFTPPYLCLWGGVARNLFPIGPTIQVKCIFGEFHEGKAKVFHPF